MVGGENRIENALSLSASKNQILINPDIYHYVSIHDSEDRAKYLLDKIETTCSSLKEFPERGHMPPELERIGVYQYREVHFKPYRILYEISERSVFIHCVLDGRRSLQEVLERRLLR
jgi:toxin ParE1/3/4